MARQYTSVARAYSNIAFIKYWGNVDHELRLPTNSSISMNLSDLHTTTSVKWSDELKYDALVINGKAANDRAIERVSKHLQLIRERFNISMFAEVDSINNFPMGTGIASSASSFAALTLAAINALGESITEQELSSIARCGSGSASRSIPAGFVEWHKGSSHETSYAETFADSDYWDLVDIIAIVSKHHKETGSSAGHPTADTSIMQDSRVAHTDQRIRKVKESIINRDFEQFADVVEEDSNLMHAVMMTSHPPLFYWEPLSLEIMKSIREQRVNHGIKTCYTLDAGPNVHCICIRDDADKVISMLESISSKIEIRQSSGGKGAHLVSELVES